MWWGEEIEWYIPSIIPAKMRKQRDFRWNNKMKKKDEQITKQDLDEMSIITIRNNSKWKLYSDRKDSNIMVGCSSFYNKCDPSRQNGHVGGMTPNWVIDTSLKNIS